MIWLVGSAIAVAVALGMLPTSLVDGQFLPVGHDSFYHARRILDTALQPGGFYEFDPKMHFPEGDWITWPWGYDDLMAQALRGLIALTGSDNPAKVLVHVPPMFVVAAVGLVLAIASALRLSEPLKWLAMLCVALSPYTQVLFGVGSLDHHWAEHLFTLAMVLCGILWLQRPESARRASALGAVLGAAVACQAGLFVLQLPVLIGLAVLWLRGETPPFRSSVALAVALVAATLLVALPSAPFRMGWFQLYYLSGFQLYIAACTAVLAMAMCRWPYRPKTLLRMALLALALLVPVLAQTQFAGAFLSGKLAAAQHIDEIRSPYAVALSEGGFARVTLVYTMLVFLAPITLIACLVALLRERRREVVFFWAASAFGLVFVMLQQRLHGFGVFALYLPWLVLLQRYVERHPDRRSAAVAMAAIVFLVAYAPAIRYQLFRSDHPPAMDTYYAGARKLFPVLAQACRGDPGLVVADPNDGHLIRYFTECSVIGNNFRLTPLDVEKFEESRRLAAMPLEQVLRERPETRYVLARLAVPQQTSRGGRTSTARSSFTLAALRPLNRGLFGDLLIGPRPLPVGVESLIEYQVESGDGGTIPVMGVYRITRKPQPE